MQIKRIIDISRKICPETTIWPGDRKVEISRELSIKTGDSCNLSSIEMGLHTGTHIDSPFHFIDSGKDIESLDLSCFIGFAKVYEVTSEKCITYDYIRDLKITEGDIVLFKTKNSLISEEAAFREDFVYLEPSAAKFLVEKKVRTVGIDYLSVDGFSYGGHETHTLLLSNNIGIIEGLYLKEVTAGIYFLSCLPLKIEGVDGSPARAVLLETE